MTTPSLDADAYRRGWHDSANGAPAKVPDEYETDETIAGYVWGWIDFVLAMTRKDGSDESDGLVRNDAFSMQPHDNA
jgi:hypothetical protein